MKTLVCLQQTPLYITNIPPLARNPINPTPTTSYSPKRIIWKINAKAKGFTGAPPNSPDRKSIRKELTIIGKSNNNDDADNKLSDVVMGRMTVRILLNVGVPLAIGIALLQGFAVVKEQNLWDVPRWLPFLTTLITFGASALGIAYGTLSASWDPEKKGSILGFEEARDNWVEMWKEQDEFNR